MIRFSLICVVFVSFLGFSNDLFAAGRGGGHVSVGRPGGGAHFSTPHMSAARPSVGHGGVHVSAPRPMSHASPRPSYHVSTPRPSTHINVRPQPHYVPAPRPYYPPVMSYARPYDTNHSHYYSGYGVGLAASIVDGVIQSRIGARCNHESLAIWSEEEQIYVCPTCGRPVTVPTPRSTRFYYNEP